MSKLITTVQEVEDLVRGVTFFGTGGGGSPKKGEKLLKEALKDVGKIELVDVDELADDATVCTCYYMGSIAPHTPEVEKKMKEMGLVDPEVERVLPEAVKLLEKHIGKKIDALVAIELGGINTPAPIDAAARLSKKIVDGDYSGRAIPEITQTSISLNNKKLTPILSVDEWGNVVLVEKVRNNLCAEAMGKAISTVAFGLVGQAACVITGKELKELIIRGTITESIKAGKILREARKQDKHPATEVAKALGGWVLFEGKVTDKQWEDKEGYFWGIHTITGVGKFDEQIAKIFFKNENHIMWLNDRPYVTSPDIITVINFVTGEPIVNPDLKVGDLVSVIGLKARSMFRSKEGIEILGPKHFGHEEIAYTPIEEKLK